MDGYHLQKDVKLNFMYKSVNGLVSAYIADLLPPLVRDATPYPLRNQNDLTVPLCRTEISPKYCIPSSILLWNSYDDELRNCSPLTTFKYQLKHRQNIIKVPVYYNFGNRYFLVSHAHIRNNCSNLSYDLYRNHLSGNPICRCSGANEDARHMFLSVLIIITKVLLSFNLLGTIIL